MLNTARVRPGESAAVFGLGGVGLAAVLGAALAGAEPVAAVDPVDRKRALALEIGATHAFTPHEAVDAIRDLTGGGADHAFEAAGGYPTVLAAAYAATRAGGATVTMGLPHPDAELTLNALSLVSGARTLKGSYMGSAVPQSDILRYAELWRFRVDRPSTG